jgi:hypothetical protein
MRNPGSRTRSGPGLSLHAFERVLNPKEWGKSAKTTESDADPGEAQLGEDKLQEQGTSIPSTASHLQPSIDTSREVNPPLSRSIVRSHSILACIMG